MPPRSLDIIHPKYHPSGKPTTPPVQLPSAADIFEQVRATQRSNTVFEDGTSAPQPVIRQPLPWRRWALIVVLVAIIGAALTTGIRASSKLFDRWVDLKPIETGATNTSTSPVNTPAPTATPAAATVTPEPTPAATPAPTPTPAPATIDKSTLKVKVLNGTGVEGAAARLRTILTTTGIPVATIGNARSYGYNTTIIYYPTGKKAEADVVAGALTKYQVSTVEDGVANGYDALVVVGSH